MSEITHAGLNITIEQDSDPESPREWDNLGKMICFHRRYMLGDSHDFKNPSAFWHSLFDDIKLTPQEVRRIVLEAIRDKDWRKEYQYQWDYWCKHEYSREDMHSNFLTDCLMDDFESLNKDIKDVILEIISNHYVILPLYIYDHSGVTIRTTSFSCPWDSGQVGWVYASHEDVTNEYGDCSPESLERAEKRLVGEVATYNQWLQGDVWGYTIGDDDDDHVDSCWGFYGQDECEAEAKQVAEAIQERRNQLALEDAVRASFVNGQFTQAREQCKSYGLNYDVEKAKFNYDVGN